MSSGQQYISKGFYNYSQLSGFVTVKNYIFIRQSGKKCLLLRFSNDLEYTVNSMAFTVIQMDAAGKVIENTKAKIEKLAFLPGSTLVSPKGIVVDENCTDFRVLFTDVHSDRYQYSVRNGQVAVQYIKNPPPIKEGARGEVLTCFSVKPRRFGHVRLSVLAATVAVILIATTAIYNVFSNYQEGANTSEVETGNDQYETMLSYDDSVE